MNFVNGTLFDVFTEFNSISAAFRILLSALIGGCIGFERGQHGRAAGLRTHILVCIGAALTVLTGFYTALVLGFNNDPLRISAQVISGVGFLGAGTIMMRNEARITGLTTAAGLWTTACIGIAIGMGFYLAAAVAFLAVMFSVTVLTKLESKPQSRNGKVYYLELEDVSKVNEFCDAMVGRARNMQIISAKSGIPHHVGLICIFPGVNGDPELLERVRQLEGVVIAVQT